MKKKEDMLPSKTPMTDNRQATLVGVVGWPKEHAWQCFARKLELALNNSRRMCRDCQREVNRLRKARKLSE